MKVHMYLFHNFYRQPVWMDVEKMTDTFIDASRKFEIKNQPNTELTTYFILKD